MLQCYVAIMKDLIISGGSFDSFTPRSSCSLPRSSTFSPSPFSPVLAKFEDYEMKECHSGTVIAGIKIGEPQLDDMMSDHHSKEEEDLSGDLYIQEEGGSQPSEMVPTTGASAVHTDVKHNAGDSLYTRNSNI